MTVTFCQLHLNSISMSIYDQTLQRHTLFRHLLLVLLQQEWLHVYSGLIWQHLVVMYKNKDIFTLMLMLAINRNLYILRLLKDWNIMMMTMKTTGNYQGEEKLKETKEEENDDSYVCTKMMIMMRIFRMIIYKKRLKKSLYTVFLNLHDCTLTSISFNFKKFFKFVVQM